MKFCPHDYQKRAGEWILDHPRSLLFLGMGMGKSVITLTAIERLRCYGEAERVLVIAPKTVAESTWSDEAGKWDHLDLRVSLIAGTPAQRRRALAADADVYVTGRDTTAWLVEEAGKTPPFDMLVIDELTSFKNPRSVRFKALRRWLPHIPRIVGLTGTPAPNGLLDLWGQVYCVDGGERLGRFVTHYRARWFDTFERNNIPIRVTPRPGAMEEIMDRLSDIALSMRSEDWLDLPPALIEDVSVRLPAGDMERYRRFERDSVMEAMAGGDTITAANAAALVNKLSQYSDGALYDDTGTVREIHSAKLDALEEIMESAGGPVLCFYQFRHDRDRIEARFPKLRVRRYEGASDLRDWNAGRIDLLLAHPASTAYGLNMQQGGSVIVWFSTGWNLELYEQANARLHRQGQRERVRIFNLIGQGTVDERMLQALRGKTATQAAVLSRLAADLGRSIG